jgi:hypothetical protein
MGVFIPLVLGEGFSSDIIKKHLFRQPCNSNITRTKEEIMKKQLVIGLSFMLIMGPFSFLQLSWARDITFIPGIELKSVYDDNLDFEPKDEKDSFGANAVPGFTLDYKSELLEFSLTGELDFIWYFTETDFDRTNQHYGFDGRYQVSPRWNFTSNFDYRRDETIDSQLEETGQAFERKRVQTYDAGGGLYYQLTELSDIGFTTDYRKRDNSSSTSNDYQRYTFGLPYTKRFTNQRDTLTLVPAYSFFDSDNSEDAIDYRFTTEWERRISETLTSEIHAGVRYTDIEQETGKNDTNWGYLGKLSLMKNIETFSGEIAATRDLRANTDAEIVEVNRLLLRADKRLLERLGFRFYGAGYITNKESNQSKNEKTQFFEVSPLFYFLLTENHSIELKYKYQRKREADLPGNPVTERNRVWLGFVLRFPKKF